MKDTLRDSCDDEADCVKNCCVSSIIAPIFFVIFVLMAQFVLVNVVVAVLMKHLEESHKQIEDDEFDMEELEREMEQAQKFEEEQALCLHLDNNETYSQQRFLPKVLSLPSDFIYNSPIYERGHNAQRRSTLQTFYPGSRYSDFGTSLESQTEMADIEMNEMKPKVRSKRNSIENEANHRRMSSVSSQTMLNKSKFERERSLEERHPKPSHRVNTKRFSVDQLNLSDYKTTNFYQKPDVKQTDKSIPAKLTNSKDSIVMTTDHAKTTLYRRSSLKYDYGHSSPSNALHLLPKAHSVNRSGSCRQLFKQHAMDEDGDVDESSLLLPVLNKSQPQLDVKNGKETSLFTKSNNETN